MAKKKFNPLPGFGLTMGYTLFYLSVLVLIPIAGLFLKTLQLTWPEFCHLAGHPQELAAYIKVTGAGFWKLTTNARALAAYKLTFGASLAAALVNAVFGSLLAWILVRYQFFGKRFIDALVDFPFALPTAVAGLTLSSLFAANGWLGRYLVPLGIVGTNTPLAVIIALTFVGLPFVVRTLQPVLQNLEQEIEEAAATLGASRLRTFVQILVPTLFPTILTGFALAFARAVGEYGSITFICGNLPYKTEIVPSLIVYQLEEHNIPGATAIAVVLLVISCGILAFINWLEVWSSRFNN